MDHIVGHLVRRGFEAHASYKANAIGYVEPQPDKPEFQMSCLGIFIIATTAVFFGAVFCMIEYTYGHLVATLSMVESPTAVVYEPLQVDVVDAPPDPKRNGSTDPEILIVKQAPITASIRTTLRHLRAKAGFWSRFRGISAWVVYYFLYARLTDVFQYLRVPMGLNGVLVAVLLSGLRMSWTHIVISEPSSKSWFRRIPSWKLWKKVALPTAILNICEQVTFTLIIGLVVVLGLDQLNDAQHWADLDPSDRKLALLKLIALVMIFIFSTVAIVVPATVSLTRIHASLLPDEIETIVPFDRSFGGRLVPAVVGGSGVIGILDAWKTFDWSSRVRLLKLYAKVIAMQLVAFFVFTAVLAVQLHLIMGNELKMYVAWVKGSIQN